MRSADQVVTAMATATARERILIAARQGIELTQESDQVAALLDLARALDAAEIAYALIGGIAVGIHSGQPRATNDVDVAVSSSISRSRVVETLTSAGFGAGRDFPHSVNLRHGSGEPIQIPFDTSFDVMIERAETVTVRGAAVRVVSKADLIDAKERAARDPARRRSNALRDQADVELLRGDVGEPDEGW